MSGVHERPEGANDADPLPPWEPSNPDRWGQLGLKDPDPSGKLPKKARAADVLARAFVAPGSADPVEGAVDSVRIELTALAIGAEPAMRDALGMLAGRLEMAMQLLRWTDNRERMPMEDEEEPPPPPAPAPTEPEPPVSTEGISRRRNADPDEPLGHG